MRKSIVLGGALVSLVACGGGQPRVQSPATVAPTPGEEPTVMIEGSSLVLIDGAGQMPLVVYFGVDSDVIDPELHPSLDALAAFLRSHHDHMQVEVQGHADERGSKAYNRGLSLRRAKAVRQYLIQHGVGADRLRATGFGERHLLVMGDDARHGLNRRAEFVLRQGAIHLSDATSASR